MEMIEMMQRLEVMVEKYAPHTMRVRELAADVRDVVGSGCEWRTRTIVRLPIRERLIKKKEEKLF